MAKTLLLRPTAAFVGASWAALILGLSAFLIGLWNAKILPSEKGFYLAVLLLGLFAAISLQKSVRDRAEGIPVTGLYFGVCWFGIAAAVSLMTIGLWNATFAASEQGFYAMSFVLSLFAVVTVQKNVRDSAAAAALEPPPVAGTELDDQQV